MLIQIVLVGLMAAALIVTWRRVRQRVIHVREALGWSVVWLLAAFFVIRPETTTRVANLFGVGRGVDFVLYASVAILFLLIFHLYLQHERIERTISRLISEEALRSIEGKNPDSEQRREV